LWLRFVLQWVRLHGARFYNFAGLDAFKAKFNPEAWEPMYADATGRTRLGKGRAGGSRSTVQVNFTYGYCRRV
jgi:phosphatidylglycerol lysyltransferase